MERPLRFCDICKQVDDHPRHIATGLTRHLDCCASEGCEVCAESVAQNNNLTGQALIDHLAALREAEGA